MPSYLETQYKYIIMTFAVLSKMVQKGHLFVRMIDFSAHNSRFLYSTAQKLMKESKKITSTYNSVNACPKLDGHFCNARK